MHHAELQYLAGFFDGEGSIMILKEVQKSYHLHRVAVSVTNTAPQVIQTFRDSFGGFVKCRELKSGKIETRWGASCCIAQSFLRQIEPCLRVKRKQAQLALEMCSILERDKRGRNRLGQFMPLSQEDKQRVEELAKEVKILNGGANKIFKL